MSRSKTISRRKFIISSTATAGVLTIPGISIQGSTHKKYNEAPMLSALVKAGKLPPVDERLPEEPLVIKPVEEIGKYGGTWRRLARSAGDTQLNAKVQAPFLIRYTSDGRSLIPNACKSWESSDDAKTFTFHLRKGMKWSDGNPYTADDLMFLRYDVWGDPKLPNEGGTWYKAGGKLVEFEKVDTYTIRMKFIAPYAIFPNVVAGMKGWWLTQISKSYHSQLIPKYANKAKLDKMIKEKGFENYAQLFKSIYKGHVNPEVPQVSAWKLKIPAPADPIVADRNPYYYKVDTEGNQLPYIDQINFAMAENKDQINMRAIQGEVDMQLRHITFENYPLFKANEEKGNYRVLLWDRGQLDQIFSLNHTNKDLVLRKIVQDKRFRFALSLGMNREEIIESNYLGMAEPSQAAPPPGTTYYWEDYSKFMIEHDPVRANKYLDEMGLTKRDSDGFRLRPDGKRLAMTYEYSEIFGSWGKTGELLKAQWKKLGLDLTVKSGSRNFMGQRMLANEVDIQTWSGSGEFDPVGTTPRSFVPTGAQGNWGTEYFKWMNSDGKEGIEPTGDILELFKIWEKVKQASKQKDREKLFRKILELNKKNLWMFGISTPPPCPVIVSKRMRNVPEKALFDDFPRGPGHTQTEQYFLK